MLDWLLLALLTLLTLTSFVANVLGLPGNWLVVAMAAGCWWLVEPERSSYVGLAPLIAIVLVAAFGELLEFIAGALGASRVGGWARTGTRVFKLATPPSGADCSAPLAKPSAEP